MNDLNGMDLGRYHLIEKLGEGGMAVVYKAFDSRLECNVAVKIIRTDQLAPVLLDRALVRFKREAKAVAQLNHPNIVKVTDYGDENDLPFLVMPYLPGGTLKELITQKGRLPWQQAVGLMIPIAQALGYAHEYHLVHRDVKPSNILLTETGQPMVSDFGIAKILDNEKSIGLTDSNVSIGTPEYMAPEQVMSNQIDQRVDIYALGVVFYEMVTGRRPFEADTPQAVMVKQTRDPLPRPTLYVNGLPPSVEHFIFKIMEKDPDNRFQSMTEVLTALDSLQATFKPGVETPNVGYSGPQTPLSTEGEKTNVDGNGTRMEMPPPVPPNIPFPPGIPNTPPEKKRSKAWVWMLVSGSLVALLFVAYLGLQPIILGPSKDIPYMTHTPRPTHTPKGIIETTEAVAVIQLTDTDSQTPSADSGIDRKKTNKKDDMEMVFVPAGEFTMGSTLQNAVAECEKYPDSDCRTSFYEDEEPVHTVYLDGFWIYKTEVTNAMYEKCVNSGNCTAPRRSRSATRDSYYGNSEFDDFPVVYVDWYEAQEYCQWAGGRLPTEAEWEKAARGTDAYTYPWGNSAPNDLLANYRSDPGDTVAVDSYPDGASPYGALNMAGNVYEWTADWYGPYSSEYQSNPAGPVTGTQKVIRGGSWYYIEAWIRTTKRNYQSPEDDFYNVGFRCVMPATE